MAERISIPVYYDFASSLCFVAHRVLGRLEGELEALAIDLSWKPLDLTRLSGWRRGDALAGLRRDNTVRVAAELEVQIQIPERWMDSRVANAIALACDPGDAERAFREQVFSGVYERGRSLDAGGWVEKLAGELGLDTESTAGSASLERLELATREAAEVDVTGVPTFLLDGWPFGGIQDRDTMLEVFSRWAAKKRPAQ